ncbi:unnamed protein product [Nippostrongylus brasiliensis]|uniref:ANK_REP_REGION domain-containing protein n=1 Tax=Nippostrongylus brasiliensis TaxID=27835 RepID=A0A158R2N8_NIPBR|nr:unnamed protein product [Nippostrongylus brasiliensis]
MLNSFYSGFVLSSSPTLLYLMGEVNFMDILKDQSTLEVYLTSIRSFSSDVCSRLEFWLAFRFLDALCRHLRRLSYTVMSSSLVELIYRFRFSKGLLSSTNTLTELAQRRHGAGTHRRSNASSTVSTHSGGRSTCAVMNTLHMAVAHKQRDIVELLLRSGYDPNLPASCHCKGNCTATGNIPLTSIIPRTHSMTPELCSTCSQLRVVSIVDQTPLGVAVRAQSSELIALLIAYGADVNLGDEDGNTPLMLAVRESPLCWPCLHTLIFFGAQIEHKNMRGICPLDLAPELRKLQQTCVEELFKNACVGDSENAPRVNSGSALRQWNRLHVDNGVQQGDRTQSKPPLSPRPSAAQSVSTSSMLDTCSAKETARRKSLVSLQLHRKPKIPKEHPVFDSVSCEQSWELLKKMANNPECLDSIVSSITRFSSQMENTLSGIDRESFDDHLGGLLHRMLRTAIEDYEQSTPTYKKQKKLHLTWLLSQMTTFCYSFIRKGGTTRQFSALSTLSKDRSCHFVPGLIYWAAWIREEEVQKVMKKMKIGKALIALFL